MASSAQTRSPRSPGLNRHMQNAVLIATMIGLFSEAARVRAGFDVKLFYGIVLVCLPAVVWVWDFTLPLRYLLFLGYLWISGILSCLLLDASPKSFLLEAIGITVCSFYFLLFFRYQDRTLDELFSVYAAFAFWISVLGFPICALQSLHKHTFVGVQSITLEPAHFCQLVIPAFFYYASSAAHSRRCRRRALIILAAVLASLATTGYIVIVLGCIFLYRRHRMKLILVTLLLLPLLTGLYLGSEHFRIRIDDSISGLVKNDLSGVNISTYAFISNVYVTQQTFLLHPLLGTGLGSYAVDHDKYAADVPGMAAFNREVVYTLNAKDANSLGLRTAAEFGMVGLTGIIWLLIRYRPADEAPYSAIGFATLLYLFLKLFREGNYFTPEMYFFVWAYLFSSARYRLKATSPAPALNPVISITTPQSAT